MASALLSLDMSGSRIFAVFVIVAAILPFALLAAVRLLARFAPASARGFAAIERRHHRAYWGGFALVYAAIGIGHLASSQGEPVFGALFLMMAGAAMIKGMRADVPR
jgi:hypothetical protein